MFTVPTSLLSGAKFIKNNRAVFQQDCLELSTLVDNKEVKAQLVAASTAKAGQCNTGLSETGWRGLAELIGMVSPSSTKLIIPMGSDAAGHKRYTFDYWLRTGYYPSSRKDGKGGSKALTRADISGEVLAVTGVRAFGRTTSGKELSASVSLAEQKFQALKNKTAPATIPATSRIVLID